MGRHFSFSFSFFGEEEVHGHHGMACLGGVESVM